ncbi:MAG: CbiX/SirB N-terminal domain-containing protein [Rhodobacteraceae bacterium]|nr:CbiX/SirB N-terminal domain-containing protein [Paracoccaceae bacterium]MCZ8084926.1 CbiX/SirB N-terminal domain-containing protein [Paracoccaceae bacterium]
MTQELIPRLPAAQPVALAAALPAALIVAHGQPSDPGPAAAEIAFLAAKVQALMPGWRIRSATLAEPDALAREVAAAGGAGLVYPLFMAGGWFTTTHLPAKLAEAGGSDWRILPPFGLDAGVQALTLTLAREAAARRGHAPADLPLLLAAHGSFRSAAPSEVAYAMADRLRQEAGFARVEAAFIDQSPRIVEAAAGFPPGSLVLPFFAARGGHVIDDLPQALAEAGFEGDVLPPVGLDARVPGLIRHALKAALKAR